MSYFPWSDEYSVHLQVIDDDHKGLVNTVNSLQEAIINGAQRSTVGGIISELVQYVDEHFSREEALMETYNYPDIAQHKRIHGHLTRTIYAIRIIFDNEPKSIDPVKLLSFLRDWLINHILDEDMRYTPFMPDDMEVEDTAPDGNDQVHAATDIKPDQSRNGEKTMTLTVPAAKASVLRGCSRLLAKGGKQSVALENMVTPAFDVDVGYAPFLPHEEPNKTNDGEQRVTLTIPAAKAAVLRGCSRLLAEGGAKSDTIEHIVMPVSKMTFDEAMRFARPILR